MALKVWLEIMQQAAAGSGALLLAALKQAQVTMVRRGDDEPASLGIVLFAQADAALLRALPACCRQARVLAIACGQPLSCAQQRAVLAAGALDVLPWPDGAIDAEQVLARLRRWQTVAQLLESNAVRRHLVGDSAAWRGLLHRVVEMAAFSQASVLITGKRARQGLAGATDPPSRQLHGRLHHPRLRHPVAGTGRQRTVRP
jgi:DNA-binding NtrC family response regulator